MEYFSLVIDASLHSLPRIWHSNKDVLCADLHRSRRTGAKAKSRISHCISVSCTDLLEVAADEQMTESVVRALNLPRRWCLADLWPLKITTGMRGRRAAMFRCCHCKQCRGGMEQVMWAWTSPHPPDALPSGTCLWKPTGLPSRSLQLLHTLGHYREQGQVADLHNTHILELERLLNAGARIQCWL